MTYHFQNLSPPYAGAIQRLSPFTLNSEILTEILSQYYEGKLSTLFPQRVPRIGFYDELAEQESDDFIEGTRTLKSKLVTDLLDFRGTPDELVCLAELALRLGITQEIIDLEGNRVANVLPAMLEIIIDAAKTRNCIHLGQRNSILGLQALFNGQHYPLFESAAIANRILVKSFRYTGSALSQDEESKYVAVIKQSIDESSAYTFQHHLRKSMFCRGLAMSRLFGNEHKVSLIDKALDLANRLDSHNSLELNIKRELIFTTMLTRAKTLAAIGSTEDSLACLDEMTYIDPLDSVAWSESGLAYLKCKHYALAKAKFETAFKLGPPARALNAYFAGEAASELGDFNSALSWWDKSSVLDNTAVSPKYESAKLLATLGKTSEARELARTILENEELSSLLEPAEVICLETL